MSSRQIALSIPAPSTSDSAGVSFYASLEPRYGQTTQTPTSPTSSSSSDISEIVVCSSPSSASLSDQSRRSSIGSNTFNHGVYQIETLLALASSPISQAITEANASSESVKVLREIIKSSSRRRARGIKKTDGSKSNKEEKPQKQGERLGSIRVEPSKASSSKIAPSKSSSSAWTKKNASQIDSMISWRM